MNNRNGAPLAGSLKRWASSQSISRFTACVNWITRSRRQAMHAQTRCLYSLTPSQWCTGPRLAEFAAARRLPSMFGWSEYCDAGGLVSYGANQRATYFGLAEYADRILRGEKPANLPVQQPTAFELTVNLKTAKAAGHRGGRVFYLVPRQQGDRMRSACPATERPFFIPIGRRSGRTARAAPCSSNTSSPCLSQRSCPSCSARSARRGSAIKDRRLQIDELLDVEARSAANRIQTFIDGIRDQLGWAVQLAWTEADDERHRVDALRLLRQVPAISSITLVDQTGSERTFVSRLGLNRIGRGRRYVGRPGGSRRARGQDLVRAGAI